MTDRPLVRLIRWGSPYLWIALGLGLAPSAIAPGFALDSPPSLASKVGRSPLAQRRRRPDEPAAGQRDARCAPIPPLPERRDRRELSMGDAGPDVVELKALLTLLGFYDGGMGGDRFEEPLSLAVQAFQQAVDVPVDGRVTLATWRLLLPVADPSAAPCNLPPERAIAPGPPSESFPSPLDRTTGELRTEAPGEPLPGEPLPGEPSAIAPQPSPVSRDRPNAAAPTNRPSSAVPPLPDAPADGFSADFTGVPAPSGGWTNAEDSQTALPPSPFTDPALAPSVGTPSTGGWVTDAEGHATGSAADLGTPAASVNRTGLPPAPSSGSSTPAMDPTLGWEAPERDAAGLTPVAAATGSPPDSTGTWPEPPPPITDDWTGGLTPNAAPAQTAVVPESAATLPDDIPSWDRPTLRQGDAGTAVRQLQTLLRDRGFLQGPIDGAFGPATEAAVRSAQQRYDLTVDGIVGPATWERLTQGS